MFVWQREVNNGAIVLNDFGIVEGEILAIEDFFKTKNV